MTLLPNKYAGHRKWQGSQNFNFILSSVYPNNLLSGSYKMVYLYFVASRCLKLLFNNAFWGVLSVFFSLKYAEIRAICFEFVSSGMIYGLCYIARVKRNFN